jgi:hypothetical protein
MQSEKEETQSIIQQEIKNLRQVYLRFPEKMYADFLIKIRHENISFRRFFQILIDAFLKDDSRINEIIDEAVKDERFKYRTEIIKKEREKMRKTIRQFKLNRDEIEDIYDLFEDDK